MTTHTFAFSTDNARINRVKVPMPPFQIYMGDRPETDPDPRIMFLRKPKPSTVKFRYTMIRKILEEALHESD